MEKIMDWRPIATAPMDGSRIILFIPSLKTGVQTGHYAHHQTLSHGKITSEYRRWYTDGTMYLPGQGDLEPSHWMPIPDGPQGDA
jgi:hypothetical protein